jgi:CRISPR-associated endonuclease/helicase Cas3
LVHPELAGYSSNLGFVPDRGTGYRAELAPPKEEKQRSRYGYRLETYVEHVRLVYQAFQSYAWPELARAAQRLEGANGWPAGVLERATNLVLLFHDVGKLNQAWQSWVQRYQRTIGQPASDEFYAHTDFDPMNSLHDMKQRSLGRRPPHAVEGAVAVAPLLAMACEECEPVFLAAFTAIARHHGAFTREFRPYALTRGAEEAVRETLNWLPSSLAKGLDPGALLLNEDPNHTPIGDLFIDPARDEAFLAYVLMARALRRADQAGTMAGSSR